MGNKQSVKTEYQRSTIGSLQNRKNQKKYTAQDFQRKYHQQTKKILDQNINKSHNLDNTQIGNAEELFNLLDDQINNQNTDKVEKRIEIDFESYQQNKNKPMVQISSLQYQQSNNEKLLQSQDSKSQEESKRNQSSEQNISSQEFQQVNFIGSYQNNKSFMNYGQEVQRSSTSQNQGISQNRQRYLINNSYQTDTKLSLQKSVNNIEQYQYGSHYQKQNDEPQNIYKNVNHQQQENQSYLYIGNKQTQLRLLRNDYSQQLENIIDEQVFNNEILIQQKILQKQQSKKPIKILNDKQQTIYIKIQYKPHQYFITQEEHNITIDNYKLSPQKLVNIIQNQIVGDIQDNNNNVVQIKQINQKDSSDNIRYHIQIFEEEYIGQMIYINNQNIKLQDIFLDYIKEIQLSACFKHGPLSKHELFFLNQQQNSLQAYLSLSKPLKYTLSNILTSKPLNINSETKLNRTPQQLIFTQEKYVYLLYQSLIILSELRNKGVYHGGIDCENLYIDENFQLRITDFNLSIILNKKDEKNMKVNVIQQQQMLKQDSNKYFSSKNITSNQDQIQSQSSQFISESNTVSNQFDSNNNNNNNNNDFQSQQQLYCLKGINKQNIPKLLQYQNQDYAFTKMYTANQLHQADIQSMLQAFEMDSMIKNIRNTHIENLIINLKSMLKSGKEIKLKHLLKQYDEFLFTNFNTIIVKLIEQFERKQQWNSIKNLISNLNRFAIQFKSNQLSIILKILELQNVFNSEDYTQVDQMLYHLQGSINQELITQQQPQNKPLPTILSISRTNSSNNLQDQQQNQQQGKQKPLDIPILNSYWLGRVQYIKAKRAFQMEYSTAQEELIKAKDQCTNKLAMIDILEMLAILNSNNSKFESSINYFQKQLYLIKDIYSPISLEVIQCLYKISHCYFRQSLGGKADIYLQQITDILNERVKIIVDTQFFHSEEHYSDFINDYFSIFRSKNEIKTDNFIFGIKQDQQNDEENNILSQSYIESEILPQLVKIKDWQKLSQISNAMIQIKFFLVKNQIIDQEEIQLQNSITYKGAIQFSNLFYQLSIAQINLKQYDKALLSLTKSQDFISAFMDNNNQNSNNYTDIHGMRYFKVQINNVNQQAQNAIAFRNSEILYQQGKVYFEMERFEDSQNKLKQCLIQCEYQDCLDQNIIDLQIDYYKIYQQICEKQTNNKLLVEILELLLQKYVMKSKIDKRNSYSDIIMNLQVYITDTYSKMQNYKMSIKILQGLLQQIKQGYYSQSYNNQKDKNQILARNYLNKYSNNKDDQNIEILLNTKLAKNYENIQQYQLSLKAIESALDQFKYQPTIQANQQVIDLIIWKSKLLEKLNKFDEAFDVLQQYLDIIIDDDSMIFERIKLFIRIGDLNEQIKEYNDANKVYYQAYRQIKKYKCIDINDKVKRKEFLNELKSKLNL